MYFFFEYHQQLEKNLKPYGTGKIIIIKSKIQTIKKKIEENIISGNMMFVFIFKNRKIS